MEFTYPPDLFATEVRASGPGIVTAGSRIGSAASTFLPPVVIAGAGINVALFACVAIFDAGGVVCAFWAPETHRESFASLDAQADAGQLSDLPGEYHRAPRPVSLHNPGRYGGPDCPARPGYDAALRPLRLAPVALSSPISRDTLRSVIP